MEPPSTEGDASKLTKYQRFTVRRMSRAQIHGAPYNPRVITPQAKKRLERNIANPKVGLLEPLIWNEVTGNLVGGHQRLATLDALEGRGDYEMDVSVVRLDEKTEREQNAFMNNPGAMGTWDIEALGQMGFRSEGGVIDWQAAGFDKIDMEDLFAGTSFASDMDSLFDAGKKAAADVLQDMEAMGAMAPAEQPAAAEGETRTVTFEAHTKAPGQAAIESFRQQEHSNNIQKREAEDTETFIVVSFASRKDRDAFMVRCGQPEGERYIDIQTLADAIGFQVG